MSAISRRWRSQARKGQGLTPKAMTQDKRDEVNKKRREAMTQEKRDEINKKRREAYHKRKEQQLQIKENNVQHSSNKENCDPDETDDWLHRNDSLLGHNMVDEPMAREKRDDYHTMEDQQIRIHCTNGSAS